MIIKFLLLIIFMIFYFLLATYSEIRFLAKQETINMSKIQTFKILRESINFNFLKKLSKISNREEKIELLHEIVVAETGFSLSSSFSNKPLKIEKLSMAGLVLVATFSVSHQKLNKNINIEQSKNIDCFEFKI